MANIYTISNRTNFGYPVNMDVDGNTFALGTYATVADALAAIEIDAAEYAVTDYIVTDTNA